MRSANWKGSSFRAAWAARAVLAGAATMLLATSFVDRSWSLQCRRISPPSKTKDTDWPSYGGPQGDRYSPLSQINRNTVGCLQVAWTYDTHELGGLQTHPLIVGRRMFVYTPSQKVVALDAATGKQLWMFDSGIVSEEPDRGFAYWTDGRKRILFAETLYALWSLDPDTGRPNPGFGRNGMIDLRNHLGAESPAGSVSITSPGVIFRDSIIMGFRTAETEPSPHGDIRAFDVHTGEMRWAFHTIPHPGEPGYETWPKEAWKYTGSANNWAGMVLDEKRGIVFVPTGSAVSDFYGADRAGDNLYANSLLALDADTGKLLWYFQAVHHDLWDRDFPAPPSLVTLRRAGHPVDAVAQTTKHGFVFLFDRLTGNPLFPIEERPFPSSSVPNETTSPTQPLPSLPEPFARQRLTADMLTTRTPEAHAWAAEQFKMFRSDGQFVPLGIDSGTVVFPGFDGGAEWGGAAVDPRTGILYVNANDVAWTGRLVEEEPGGPGIDTYQTLCSSCHGTDRAGAPPAFPSLRDASKNLTPEEMSQVIHSGRGRMPSYPEITGTRLEKLVDYVRTGRDPASSDENDGPPPSPPVPDRPGYPESPTGSAAIAAPPAKYHFSGYHKFLDPEGYPAVEPPWGTLNAIDLNTGRYVWKISLGEYPELTARGIPVTGSENYGGPIATAGGLVIIGATNFDHKIRAFDSASGKLLWEHVMRYSGNATPATYSIDGKQYVVIATSDARAPLSPQGAEYVAFALP
jgi:quinoprotein glucose dehydrogenase